LPAPNREAAGVSKKKDNRDEKKKEIFSGTYRAAGLTLPPPQIRGRFQRDVLVLLFKSSGRP
jgi:hypothetical protein